jgi:hypothetical protein
VKKGRNFNNWFCGGVALQGYLETQTNLAIQPEQTICTRSDVTGLVLNRKQRRNRLQCRIVVAELNASIRFNLRCDKAVGWLSGRVIDMSGRSRLEALTTISLGFTDVTSMNLDVQAVVAAIVQAFVDAIVASANTLVGGGRVTIKPNDVFIHVLIPYSIVEFSVQGQVQETSCSLETLFRNGIETFAAELAQRNPSYTKAQISLNSFTLCKKCECTDFWDNV